MQSLISVLLFLGPIVLLGGMFSLTSVHTATADLETLEISPQPTREPSPQPSPSPSPSPTPTPSFSCCEHDIKVNQVQVDPQKTTQLAGAVQVSIDFKLDINWRCDVDPERECLAFYEITLENSNWEEFVGGKWVAVDAANVTESIIPDPPLKTACDGKTHKGTWSYSYIATITTVNPIRNTELVFDWDVPEAKGTSYHSEYQVSGVSPTTGTKPPTVKGSHPKKK